MRKILVLATGWHFSSHFYEEMIKQKVPKGWEVDYYCIAHRTPENEHTIKEKDDIRNLDADNFLYEIDRIMYDYPITTKQIEDLGWKFMLEDNTCCDVEIFNQWTDHYDYKEYDIINLTHDDNYMLSDNLFLDILENNIKVYKPIIKSRYGVSNHQFKTEEVSINDMDWMFLENGYSEHIPKAFTPRSSFCLFKKEFVDLLPGNKFDITETVTGNKLMSRVGKTKSFDEHMDLNDWNSPVGTLREWMYNVKPNLEMLNHCGWLSTSAQRVSKYCIEGERGLIQNHKADCGKYIPALMDVLKNLGMLST
tara:strand:- start:1123 stop:2046 length:924 start_codon:yes stop_codon:yes gene_type:complete